MFLDENTPSDRLGEEIDGLYPPDVSRVAAQGTICTFDGEPPTKLDD